MELGGFLDDDLFEEHNDKNTRTGPVSYNAKICNPEWFEESTSDDKGGMMQLHKHRADWAYRCKEYKTALQNYLEAIDRLPASNFTMLRDMLESTARCYLKLQQPEDALITAHKLGSISPSYDQKTVHLCLTADIYRALRKPEDELLTLQKVIWLHPMVCDTWVRLLELYMELLTPQAHATDTEDQPQRAGVHQQGRATTGTCTEVQKGLQVLTVSGVSSDGQNVKERTPVNQVSSGMAPRYVITTCILRARALAASIRKHPQFVTERYQQIWTDLNEQLSELHLEQGIIKQCLPHVTQDLSWDTDANRPSEGRQETQLIKTIDEETFRATFEQHWFGWR